LALLFLREALAMRQYALAKGDSEATAFDGVLVGLPASDHGPVLE